MGYLNGIGIYIYRLKEVKETDEFLFYDKNVKKYNQYSFKRLISILAKTILDMEIDFKEFIKKVLGEGYKKIEYDKFIANLVIEEHKLIDNISYKPCEELLFKEDNYIYFNIYNKSKLLKKKKLKDSNFTNINLLIMNLVGDNEEEYNYFCKWLSWKIKNPLIRLPTAIILQGEHGTGKTKFCELVLKPIFENNFSEIGQADINKDYNDYMLGKEIIVANEVIHNDNKFLVPDKLKNYVTDEYISINRKFKDTTYQRNYTQWIFVTNNKVPLKIERGDRRYSVFKSKKLENGFKLISDLLENHEEEIEGFLNYLINLQVKFDEVAKPLENKAKEEIIKYGNSSVDDFLDELKEYEDLDLLSRYDREIIYELKPSEEGVLVPTSKLYKCYVEYCQDYKCKTQSRQLFTRHLKSLGFEDKVSKDQLNKPIRVIIFKDGWENNIQ